MPITLPTLPDPSQMNELCDTLRETSSAEITHNGKQFSITKSLGNGLGVQGKHSDVEMAAFHDEMIKFAKDHPNAH